MVVVPGVGQLSILNGPEKLTSLSPETSGASGMEIFGLVPSVEGPLSNAIVNPPVSFSAPLTFRVTPATHESGNPGVIEVVVAVPVMGASGCPLGVAGWVNCAVTVKEPADGLVTLKVPV